MNIQVISYDNYPGVLVSWWQSTFNIKMEHIRWYLTEYKGGCFSSVRIT